MENQDPGGGPAGSQQREVRLPAQPLTADFLKEQIADLKRRVLATQKVKPDEIKKEIAEHQEVVGKDEELLVLVDEALVALDKFEKKLKKRVNTEEEFVHQLEKLNNLVISLERQRNEAIEKYESVEHQLETEEKIWFKEKANDAMVSLKGKIERLVKELNAHEGELANMAKQKEGVSQELKSSKAKLYVVIQEAIGKLGPSHAKTRDLLGAVHNSKAYAEFLSGLAAHKKTLGWLAFTERSVINAVLSKSQLFIEADQKLQAFENQETAEKSLNARIEKMAGDFSALMNEAADKQQGLIKSFNLSPDGESPVSLPDNVLAQIESAAKDKGLWVKVRDRIMPQSA